MKKQKLHAWIYAAAILLALADGCLGLIPFDWGYAHRESNRALVLERMVVTFPIWAGFVAATLRDKWRDHLAAFAAAWTIPCFIMEFNIWGWGFPSPLLFILYLPFIGICFGVVLGLHAAVIVLASRSLRGMRGWRLVIVLVIAYSVFPLLLHEQVPKWQDPLRQQGTLRIPSQEPAMETLTLLDKCALEFASRHNPRSYPLSLSEFGFGKLGCLPDAVANRGASEGYRYSYNLAPRSEPKEGPGYEARAQWKSFWVQGVFELDTDENAVFRWSENLDGLTRSSTFLLGPRFDFGECVRPFLRSSPFPVTADFVMKNCFGYNDHSLKGETSGYYKGRWQRLETEWLDTNTFNDGRYIWKVEMLEDVSRDIKGFIVHVRPKEWGVSAFRSYLVQFDFWPRAKAGENSSTVPRVTTHATVEDREATVNDPMVWEWGDEPLGTTKWMGD